MEPALTETWVTVATGDGPMRLFTVRPDAPGPFPGLVVVQEAFGVNDHIQDVCRRFAARGHVVVSPDLFHRQGTGTLPYSEIATAKKLLSEVTDDQVADDLDAAIGALRDDTGVTPGSIAVVGYCFGGRCAYLAATRFPELTASVVYYGGRIAPGGEGPLLEATPAIGCPVLGHFGAEDASIPPEEIRTIDEALGKAGVDHLLVTYPDAGHGFACDARPANFHAEATASAWDLTTAFLSAAFAGDPHPARTVSASRSASPSATQGASARGEGDA